MDKLTAGVQKFRQEGFTKRKDLFGKLEGGQSPRVLFVTCSDSRVVPSLITSSEPGELFVIRNAGNLVPPYGHPGGEAATLEYAVNVLGVKHIVVCGHSGCGAMNGLLNPESLATLPVVSRWLDLARSTRDVVEARADGKQSAEEKLSCAVETNALHQIDNLRTHPCIAGALARNALSLHAWVYDIGTGAVMTYDTQTAKYVELADALRPVVPRLVAV